MEATGRLQYIHLAPSTLEFVIGYFKERNTFQFPALALMAIVLKAIFVGGVNAPTGYFDAGGLLVPFLNKNVLPSLSPGFITILSLLLLVGSAVYANLTLSNRRMFGQRHSLVAMSMLLFTSLFPGTNLYLPALLLLPVLISVFSQLTLLYNTSNVRSTIVNAGMLAGLGYLLYHPFIFILPACFIGLAYMRPFRLADWLLLLLGMATPLYFVLAAEYLGDIWMPQRHLPAFGLKPLSFQLGPYWWAAIVVVLVWIMAAFSAWQTQLRRMVIQGRKNWYALLMIALLCLPGIVIPMGNYTGMLTLLSFPLGSLLASAFATEKKAVGQLVFFWVIILVIAWVGWGWKTGAIL